MMHTCTGHCMSRTLSLGAAGGVAGQGCLLDLWGAWPLVLLWFFAMTGTTLGMGVRNVVTLVKRQCEV